MHLFGDIIKSTFVYLKEIGFNIPAYEAEKILSVSRNLLMRKDSYEDVLGQMREIYTDIDKGVHAYERKQRDELLVRIKAYIKNNLRENLSADILAEEFGFSARYFSRRFKELEGVTLSDYIARERVDEACRLLVSTDYRIDEIGDMVGMPSKTTFMRVFGKITGVTPGRYRAENKNQY